MIIMRRILFFTHEIDYAGTWRSHERIIEKLDRTRFEPFVAYWDKCPNNNRLDIVAKLVGDDHIISYSRTADTKPRGESYEPVKTNFARVIEPYNFDIIHYARSGYPEWPFIKRLAPVQIETNIFGYRDDTPYLDGSIAIANCVAEMRGGADVVIPNPIPAAMPGPNLRDQLNIPSTAIVCGRIGRPANFTPIAFEAYLEISNKHPELYFVIIAPHPGTRSYKLPNVILIEPTNDDYFIDSFYRTIDLFLHYRSDGEIHSTAIAQAMMHRVPIISHTSHKYNGQAETIGPGGFIADDPGQYAKFLDRLVNDLDLRINVGNAGYLRALDFEARSVVDRIMEFYDRF